MSKGNFSFNAVKLAVGNSFAQLISIATVPIITRLYDPSQFGIFSIFVGIVALISPVSTLQYHTAMVLPDDDGSVWLLRKVSLNSVIVVSVFCMACAIIIAMVVHYGNLKVALVPSGVIWLVAPSVLIQGMLLIDTTWIMRYDAFGGAAVARALESGVEKLIGILSGLLQPIAIYLAASKMIGGMVAWRYARKKVINEHAMRERVLEPHQKAERQLAFRYKEFAVYSSIAVLAAASAREIPVILLGAQFGPAYAAYYALGLRVVNMPMITVGDAVAKSFFQYTAALARNSDGLAEPAIRIVKIGFLLATPPLVLLAVHGQTLFSIIFGERWAEAGTYVTALAPAYLFLFVARPIASLFDVLEQQKRKLGWTLFNLVGRVAAVIGAYVVGGGVMVAVWGITVVTVISQTGTILHLLHEIGVIARQLSMVAGRVILLLTPALVGIPAAAFILEDRIALIVGVFLLAAHIALLFMLDHDMRKLMGRLFNLGNIK